MLEFINKLGNDEVQANLMLKIEKWYVEVGAILPELPENIKIYFFDQDDPGIMPEFGVGGYAYSLDTMSLGFALEFEDKLMQLKQLKSTIFHEGLHIAQGYVGSGEKIPLVECMIYEGLATVFEREILGNHQPYGLYPADEKIIKQWIESIKLVETPWKFIDYSKWGFTDPESGEKWRLYKAGTWVIDRILENNKNVSLNSLIKLKAKDILILFKT